MVLEDIPFPSVEACLPQSPGMCWAGVGSTWLREQERRPWLAAELLIRMVWGGGFHSDGLGVGTTAKSCKISECHLHGQTHALSVPNGPI